MSSKEIKVTLTIAYIDGCRPEKITCYSVNILYPRTQLHKADHTLTSADLFYWKEKRSC